MLTNTASPLPRPYTNYYGSSYDTICVPGGGAAGPKYSLMSQSIFFGGRHAFRIRDTSVALESYKRCFSTNTSDYPSHEVMGMPALSPTMEMGNMVRWNMEEGDQVSAGEVVCEIETDKATVDYEAQDEGYLAKILVPEGTMDVPVGTPIFVIVEEQEHVAAFQKYSTTDDMDADPTPATTASSESDTVVEESITPSLEVNAQSQSLQSTVSDSSPLKRDDNRLFASPFARKIAREAGVILEGIVGSGPNGRIIANDVNIMISSSSENNTTVPMSIVQEETDETMSSISSHVTSTSSYTETSTTEFSRTFAKQLEVQKKEVPHYHLTSEIAIDALLKIRAEFETSQGTTLSVNDFLLLAAAKAAQQVPQVNSSWMGNTIRQYHLTHMNVVMANSQGHVVAPVIRSANHLGLTGMSMAMANLMEKTEQGALNTESDMTNGTFTVSNLGMFGVKSISPIVSPMQACSLAFGTIEKVVIPNEAYEENEETGQDNGQKMYRYSKRFHATLACDHRVVDGAVGAQYLAAFKSLVEQPLNLLL